MDKFDEINRRKKQCQSLGVSEEDNESVQKKYSYAVCACIFASVGLAISIFFICFVLNFFSFLSNSMTAAILLFLFYLIIPFLFVLPSLAFFLLGFVMVSTQLSLNKRKIGYVALAYSILACITSLVLIVIGFIIYF